MHKHTKGGNVAFQNFEEVWAALGRLYSDIVKLQESQQQFTIQLGQLGEKIDRLSENQEQLIESLKQLVGSQAQLIESQTGLVESQNRLVSTVATLTGTVGQMASMIDSHERRMQRLEGQ